MGLGRVAATEPLSEDWGFDRGTAIDRHYIHGFLGKHATDIKGDVLEVAEDDVSKRFGGDRVTRQHIIDLDPGNPRATMIGDLTDPTVLPAEAFDCIILTQTLHLIFDMPSAVAQLYRALKPGGVALITVPGITPIDRGEWKNDWYWSLTGAALRRLLCGPFDPAKVNVEAYGNLHAATAFLHGAAVQDTNVAKLAKCDPAYPVTVAARAIA